MRTEEEVLSVFNKWAKAKDLIRAAILTSSRARPAAEIDFFLIMISNSMSLI